MQLNCIEAEEYDGKCLDNSIWEPVPKDLSREALFAKAYLVLGRVFKEGLFRVLVIEHSEPHDGNGGKHDVIELVNEFFVHEGPREHGVEPEPKVGHDHDDVLVEIVADKEPIASVGLSSVLEEEWLQESELSYNVVCASSRLLSFKAADAYSDVGSSDHVHIVSSVADREGYFVREPISNDLHNVGLLLRRNSAS